MITVDTRVTGFDARTWLQFVNLLAPGLTSHAPHAHARRLSEPGGMLLVCYQGDRVLRAVHTHRGVVPIEAWPGPALLEALAQAQGVRVAVAAEAGALEEFYERLGGRLRADDDLWATALIAWGALRELSAEGVLHVVPRLGAAVPLLPPDALRRAWDHVLPDGHAAVVALFEGEALDTAIIARRVGTSLDRVWGPEALRGMVGPLGGDFRRDYRVIRAVIERDVGPLSVGLYARTSAVRELLREGVPGGWARALASREVVLDPLPPWAAVAAGAGALRGAAVAGRELVTRLDPLGLLAPVSRRLAALSDAVGSDLAGTLGFDPLALAAGLLRRPGESHRPPPTDERVP